MQPKNRRRRRPVINRTQKIILQCMTCIFWRKMDQSDGAGECERNAPVVNPTDEEHKRIFPITYDSDYCGEYAPGEPQCSAPCFCQHTPDECGTCDLVKPEYRSRLVTP
jgi:hypothetical protein